MAHLQRSLELYSEAYDRFGGYRPGRTSPRFPPRLEEAVRAAIRSRLEQSAIRIGYASAACGWDILFLEEILERGGEAHVVLPHDRGQFMVDSVEIVTGPDWGERFRRVVEGARVTTASRQRIKVGGISYNYTNMILHGLATLRAELLAGLPCPPVKKNTWGDGLYLVFDGPAEAGRFALDLRDSVVAMRWEELGLPASLGLRIGLHAGPVYLCVDPVTERPNCIGTHVSHAARIEPITPPNQVFASQAFAALAAAERVRDFACHYVGQTPLAKGHGIYPTYHVHRRD